MSVRLHLVRHGRAAAGWNVDRDPVLDELGQQQAVDVAHLLVGLGPLPVYSSPLRRCQETSGPLSALWKTTPTIEPRVAEIPSPVGVALEERVEWLRGAMAGTWTQLGISDGDIYTQYRRDLLDTLFALSHDAVIFSHFIAINVVIGEALSDDRLVVKSLDNCSVTTVVVHDGKFTIEEMGREADTLIR
jgi:broad specificity phosphatase PhoE